ncbi:MAG: hypothetical protein DMF87_07520 [Acidobacteria bacterium]|nr:MAG: hypothetical protein DMF88_02250 [Acidobacteriota bacterium]PYR80837.1 MAG: hypothetical protein DMF87_07520 [Acidobacteriota bacterium]
MSEFRFEKLRISATLTLAPGTSVSGSFFVAGQTSNHEGAERIGDLLNGQPGFFPFELRDGTTVLYNRAHLVAVALEPGVTEAERDPGYDVATHRNVGMLLSTGMRVKGRVAVYAPQGRDRLSDYARAPEMFRYVVTQKNTLIINATHIVELTELAD